MTIIFQMGFFSKHREPWGFGIFVVFLLKLPDLSFLSPTTGGKEQQKQLWVSNAWGANGRASLVLLLFFSLKAKCGTKTQAISEMKGRNIIFARGSMLYKKANQFFRDH